MTDIKISGLPSSTTVTNGDLLEISKKFGATYSSRQIDFSTIKESMVGKKTVTVSANTGADANTIKGGIALAAAMSPSFSNPIVVLVAAGLYNEVNPLVIPDNISVISEADSTSTMVGFLTPNANGFELGTKTILRGFSIYAYVPNVNGIYYRGAYSEAHNITIINCETGFLIENADPIGDSKAVNCSVLLVSGTPSNCSTAFLVKNASFLTIFNSAIWGLEANYIGTAFDVQDANSGIDVYSTSVYGCNNGFIQKDDSYNYMENVSFGTCDIALQCSGGTLFTTGVQITYSNDKDILIDDVSAVVRFLGTANSSKFNVVYGASFYAQIQDLNPLSTGSRTIGQTISESRMMIGYPNAIVENPEILLDVGEGAAYSVDKFAQESVEYWQYDASAASGSRFTRFTNNSGVQLASNGSSIVVGSKFLWSSSRLDIDTAANVGSSSIVAEFWNGTSWTPIGIAAYNRQDLVNHANRPFQNRERQFVEHSVTIYDGNWYSDNDVLDQIPAWDNTFDMYTVRYRNVGNLVSGMEFAEGRVKGDGYQVSANTTKRITAWGKNRLTVQDTVNAISYIPHSTYPADSYSVDISAHIKSTIPNCKFTKNTKKAFCDLHYIQPHIDTSTPLILQLDVVPLNDSDNPTGKIVFQVYAVVLARGQILDGSSSEIVSTVTISTNGTSNVILAVFASIDLSAYPTSTAIALTVERNDGFDGDEYMGSVAVPLIIYNHTRKII